ncbi:MAG: type II secretion system F family protein [bacterium]
MPTFRYEAQAEDGAFTKGTIEAASSEVAYTQLEHAGYTPISLSEKRDIPLSFDLSFNFERISTDDLIFFTKQLRTIIKSGIPFLSGLEAIEEQTENKKLKNIISTICQDVDKGNTFSASLAQHPKVFPEVYINMIQTGEVGGKLQDILDRLIFMLEFNRKTKEKLKAAMRYPMFVIFTLCTASIFLLIFVVPKFAAIFEKAKIELPLPTRIMLSMNSLVQNYWYLVLTGIAAMSIACFLYLRKESGRLTWDRLRLKIPILGPLFLKLYMSRFSKILETLLRSGIPIVNALEVVAGTLGNAYIAMKLGEIAQRISAGMGVIETFKESKTFPPLVIRMISTGVETGALDDMLAEITDYYERDIDYVMDRLSSLIEPILTVTLGIIVLFLALAIFLPWWDMLKAIKGG